MPDELTDAVTQQQREELASSLCLLLLQPIREVWRLLLGQVAEVSRHRRLDHVARNDRAVLHIFAVAGNDVAIDVGFNQPVPAFKNSANGSAACVSGSTLRHARSSGDMPNCLPSLSIRSARFFSLLISLGSSSIAMRLMSLR